MGAVLLIHPSNERPMIRAFLSALDLVTGSWQMCFFPFFSVQNKMPTMFSPVRANVSNIAVIHCVSLEPGVSNYTVGLDWVLRCAGNLSPQLSHSPIRHTTDPM